MADIAQFETTLINLAVNSRDAMQDEGLISIRVARPKRSRQSVTSERRERPIYCDFGEDVGVGIAPENLTAIFEPFYTTKEVGKGTGLGLSQALGFAKQSGGEIVAASALGQGSTFTIYLPEAEAPDSRSEFAVANPDAAASGHGHRILLVEDNEDIGKVLHRLLQDLGYETRRADNAKQALALIAADRRAFDLVFSDVIMPGMNGVETRQRLFASSIPHLPVVLTSGYSSVLAENAIMDSN